MPHFERSFAYKGHPAVRAMVDLRCEEAGWYPVKDIDCAQTVYTYCTSQSELENIYFGDEGLVQMAQPNTILVDLSATTPTFSRELNAVAVVNDLVYIEAPLVVTDITLHDAFTTQGNVCALVGAEKESIHCARPALDVLVGSVKITGGPGSAQLVRAMHTLQQVATLTATVEADALSQALQSLCAPLHARSVRSALPSPFVAQLKKMMKTGQFKGTYTIEILMAELSAALMAADDAEVILPQAESSQHLIELLAIIGGSQLTPAALCLLFGDAKRGAGYGLDWSRAEQVYGDGRSLAYQEDDYFNNDHEDDREDVSDHQIRDVRKDAYPGFLDYSAN